jgi:hypothetical protein
MVADAAMASAAIRVMSGISDARRRTVTAAKTTMAATQSHAQMTGVSSSTTSSNR